ncbi:MAG: endo-1,4-beta-xylanase [Crenarchaeota archaeon]|nr:endo-1,4-beta-xylanase [Thermoproteota archaeon]MDW8033556.1 endo-1,4-beta-xylanase [Nitrososphaerota archaeon]
MLSRRIMLIYILLIVVIALASLFFLSLITRNTSTRVEKPSGGETNNNDVYTPLAKNYTLKSLADRLGLKIGTAISFSHFDDANYIETIVQEFNTVTPENEMKFVLIHPFPSIYTFSRADRIVEFAEKHGLKVRGHCLVWHQQLPDWITQGNFTREEWIQILRDHIMTVVSRYRGKVYAWDVVNEAVTENGYLRNSVWLRNIGPEYIELAFRLAHEADPNALLFYNDYGIESINRKSDGVYNLIKTLLKRGVPIHGVGFQMHISIERYPDPDSLAENIKRFRELGLQVEITEMDVSIPMPASNDELAKQAEIYKKIFKTYLDSAGPNTFIMWGFTDKYSWIPYTFSESGAALIFDEKYRTKPAYYALVEVLLEELDEISK